MFKVAALVCAMALVGCAKGDMDYRAPVSRNSETPSAPKDTRTNLEKLDSLKWGGVIQFTGGVGSLQNEDSKNKFRVNLCLEKTEGVVKTIELKLLPKDIGFEILNVLQVQPGNRSITRELKSLNISITYSTKTVQQFGDAFSDIQAKIVTAPNFKVVSTVGEVNALELNEILNRPNETEIQSGQLGYISAEHFDTKNRKKPKYIYLSVERPGFFAGPHPFNTPTTSCEGQDKSIVIQKM